MTRFRWSHWFGRWYVTLTLRYKYNWSCWRFDRFRCTHLRGWFLNFPFCEFAAGKWTRTHEFRTGDHLQ